ncbi:PAS domain-containing protein [Desulfofundulus thermobenzoicus]|uniref:histidine kinase n=1 Tax=Desulfofundulus thermobenzoicus TaxID=29376 RepID=A0A6N7IPG3_9FIRM|nr:ATP-binding protein [Desulfofundulus thermobenzoicus]MQL51493.1 PAS domain-containing protein [Desulfofundulus thermobenzoicus]
MVNNRTGLRWVAWFILVLLPVLVLLYTGSSLPRHWNGLQLEFQREIKYDEVSSDLYNLTGSVQEYLFYGDQQALNDFRHYSTETLKRELELYNLVEQSRKQDVAELMALTRAYNSFVDREVIPGRESNRELLLWQHRDLHRQLLYRAGSLTERGGQENKALLERNGDLFHKAGLLMVFLSLLSLGALSWAGIWIWPRAAWYFNLQELIGDSEEAVVFVDRRERVRFLNRAAEELFHLPRETVAGKSLQDILTVYPHCQGVVQPLYQALVKGEKTVDCRLSYNRRGSQVLLTVNCAPAYFFHWLSGAVLTARRLPGPRDGGILLETIERERKHLSIEIHDWIGRYLSSIIHGLDYALRVNGKQLPEELQKNLCLLRTQCQNAAIDMRSIMNDLHPYLIEKVGLIPALESYSANFERIHGRKVYIFYRRRSLPLDREKELFIYRIVQEALTNVARHSPATEVDIHFHEREDTLQIEIMDNGGMQEKAPTPGKGLWGMKERARFMGGDLFYGFMEGGFCVTLTVPLTGKGEGQ